MDLRNTENNGETTTQYGLRYPRETPVAANPEWYQDYHAGRLVGLTAEGYPYSAGYLSEVKLWNEKDEAVAYSAMFARQKFELVTVTITVDILPESKTDG